MTFQALVNITNGGDSALVKDEGHPKLWQCLEMFGDGLIYGLLVR